MSKTILITGASRGIGRAAALLAGQHGWSVAVNYRADEQAAQAVVAGVIATGGKATAVQGDVSVEADVVRLFEVTEREFGPLDGVVVNAGITAPSLPLIEMTGERIRQTFAVNTIGAYLCAREAARRLVRSRGGRGGSIVLVSSIAARLGSPNEFVDYAGAKGAVDTLTVGLSKELGPEGVRVNAVRPGLIHTDIHASGGDPGRADRLGVTTPFGRAGLPEEIAQAIVWLLSDAASYASGAILDISGGR